MGTTTRNGEMCCVQPVAAGAVYSSDVTNDNLFFELCREFVTFESFVTVSVDVFRMITACELCPFERSFCLCSVVPRLLQFFNKKPFVTRCRFSFTFVSRQFPEAQDNGCECVGS